MPFNPEKPDAKPALSNDPELNEMLERMGKIIENGPPEGIDPLAGTRSVPNHVIKEKVNRRDATKKRPQGIPKKVSRFVPKPTMGTTWVGMVGDKIDEAERRMEE